MTLLLLDLLTREADDRFEGLELPLAEAPLDDPLVGAIVYGGRVRRLEMKMHRGKARYHETGTVLSGALSRRSFTSNHKPTRSITNVEQKKKYATINLRF